MSGPVGDIVDTGNYEGGSGEYEGNLVSQESVSANGVIDTTLEYRIGDPAQEATANDILSYVKRTFGHYYGALNGVAQCISVNAKQLAHPKGVGWDVTVKYSTNRTGPYQYWAISVDHVKQNKVLETAYSGWHFEVGYAASDEEPAVPGSNDKAVSITNSAGEAFDPPLEQELERTHIKLGILALPDSQIASIDWTLYHNTMNRVNVGVAGVHIPQWCGLLTVQQTRQPYVDASGELLFLIKLDMEITVRDETWRRAVLDVGMNYISTGKDGHKTLTPFGLSGHKERGSARPQKLDGNGGSLYLSFADPTLNEIADDAWYCGFFTYTDSDWNDLNLPFSIQNYDIGVGTGTSTGAQSDSAGGSTIPSVPTPDIGPAPAPNGPTS